MIQHTGTVRCCESAPAYAWTMEIYFGVLQGKSQKILIGFLNEVVAQELNNDSLHL